MSYVRAAGRFGVGVYDRAIAVTMREGRWRPRLRDAVVAGLPERGRVVDIGAGTGTLAIALAAARPDAEVVGIDGDPEALALARGKTGADRVRWTQALAAELPLPDASADVAVMSLLLHHLPRSAKTAALAQAARVLRPGGELHVADWGVPGTGLARAGFVALRLIDGAEGTRDHAAGRLPEIIARGGFAAPVRYGRVSTVWGTLDLLKSYPQGVSSSS